MINLSLRGALTAFFWAGLVRVALAPRQLVNQLDLPHVRPAPVRRPDKAINVWPLAILPLGEPWHNLHHADPPVWAVA
jgi:stearoyl-CoA desaturase (delta-9 desaturase)